MFRGMLPRIYMIIEEINARFLKHVRRRYPNDEERVRSLSIIQDNQVHMARLAVVGSYSVNGVAAIHSEILKRTTLRPFFEFFPAKFNNKTNGITHRRWLIAANPELADFLDEKLTSAWQKRPELLSHLAELQDDPDVLQRLADIKLTRKKILARKVREKTGLRLDPDTLFDIQVKRIHSYKRQLMNVLHIMYQYDRLRRGKDADMVPTTYFFGGKAAPGYYIAKETIRLICAVADVVNNDPATNKMLKVVFIENFGVSIGEVVYPAADVSEQISTASKEASGTGNMKFMMNGAITLGTMDGANVEIHEAVGGDEHCVIFGLTAEKVMDYYANGKYSAWEEYNNNESVRRVLDRLVDGTYGDFRSLFDYLLQNNDEFFILKDFDAYREAHEEIMRRYRDREKWNRSMLLNIAASGRFSSDRTIEEYANDIWHLKPVTVK
jgi:starch phosphorylase